MRERCTKRVEISARISVTSRTDCIDSRGRLGMIGVWEEVSGWRGWFGAVIFDCLEFDAR